MRLRRMMFFHNTKRRVEGRPRRCGWHGWRRLVTLMGAGLVLLMPVTLAVAQDVAPAAPQAKNLTAPDEAPWLDENHARQLLEQIETALAQAGTAATAGAPIHLPDFATLSPPVYASDVAAVRVTLRLSGMTLGTGTQVVDPLPMRVDPRDNLGRPVVNLSALGQAATELALVQVQQRWQLQMAQRQAVRGLHVPSTTPPHAATPQTAPLPGADPTLKGTASWAEVDWLPRLCVDVQIARRPRPVLIPVTDPETAVYFAFVPGYHGLVLSIVRPDPHTPPQRAWVWPIDAMMQNQGPQAQVGALMKDLGLPESLTPQISRPQPAGTRFTTPSLELARFAVVHIVRPNWSSPPLVLVRGQSPLPVEPVTAATLESMARRMTAFLLRRQQPDGQASGVYAPASDTFDPATASWPETALGAYALARRHAWLSRTRPDDPQTLAAAAAVRQSLRFLLREDAAAPALSDPATAALVVLTLPHTPWIEPSLRQRGAVLADKLMSLRLRDGGFAGQFNARTEPANLPVQALILAALARAELETPRSPATADRRAMVQATLDQLWHEHTPGEIATAMPWLAQAEFFLHSASAASAPAQGETLLDEPTSTAQVPANSSAATTPTTILPPEAKLPGAGAPGAGAQRLLALAKALRAQLIRRPPDRDDGPADVVGGFDVTPHPPQRAPYPDWRSSQFLAFLAQTLGRDEFRQGPDALAWVLDDALAARFLGQLMYDDPGTFFARSPDDALGGIRLAPFDTRVSTPSTAMALLAITELQETIQTLSQDRVSP